MQKFLLGLITLVLYCGTVAAAQFNLSPDPAVLKRIKTLAPNQAVSLGQARTVGDFNDIARHFNLDKTGPRARDYTLKMVWAPERKRALFTGANHGSPHRLNDVWEFDLAAMAWILLYAPDNPRSYSGLGHDSSDVLFRDGVLITRRGGPAIIAHTWSGLTYDPVNQRLLFMNTWPIKQDKSISRIGGDPAQRYIGPPLWAFSPATGEWSLLRTEPPVPQVPPGAMLEFVPELEGAIWHMNNWQMRATWLYKVDENQWIKLAASEKSNNFQAQAPSRELVGYHDPVRKQVIAHQGRGTFHFDTNTRTWTKVYETPDEDKSTSVPDGHDAKNVFYYDPASGNGLLIDFGSRSLWSYDPDRIEWKKLTPEGDPLPSGRRMLAYFDQARNVLVVIDDLQVWVYRPLRK